jgi:K(+)-stimulated pyrophosphate-energized sodium pump
LGLLASIVGVMLSRIGGNGDPGKALNRGTYVTCAIFAVLTLGATLISGFSLRLWGAAMLGMVAGVIIGFTSEFFTGDDKKPVENVARACQKGPAFTILSGFSYGLWSTLPSMAGIGLAALLSYRLCEPLGADYAILGIAIAALGMLSVVGMIISNDAYGPIVDNARGLAEMSGMGDDVLEITDKLDSAGNTSKAITKGLRYRRGRAHRYRPAGRVPGNGEGARRHRDAGSDEPHGAVRHSGRRCRTRRVLRHAHPGRGSQRTGDGKRNPSPV